MPSLCWEQCQAGKIKEDVSFPWRDGCCIIKEVMCCIIWSNLSSGVSQEIECSFFKFAVNIAWYGFQPDFSCLFMRFVQFLAKCFLPFVNELSDVSTAPTDSLKRPTWKHFGSDFQRQIKSPATIKVFCSLVAVSPPHA